MTLLGRATPLAVAVVLAGFIWGFGHAGYPQQPFYYPVTPTWPYVPSGPTWTIADGTVVHGGSSLQRLQTAS